MRKPKTMSGTREWAVKNVNCVTGCSHACRYCYARASAIRFDRKTYANWPEEEVRPWDVNKLRRKEPGRVMFPTTHDITPNILKPCLTVLGKLLDAGNEVLVVSKPHKECIEAICEAFFHQRAMFTFRFTIGAVSPFILSYWEPGAPGFDERLECLRFAYDRGFQTSVSAEPLLEAMKVEELIETLLPYITDTLWIGKMNRVRQRVWVHTREDELMVQELLMNQTDQAVWEYYRKLKDVQAIRWKESIKKVVGLKLSTRPGEDR